MSTETDESRGNFLEAYYRYRDNSPRVYYHSDFAQRYFAEGMAEGKGTSVLKVLQVREVPVAKEAAKRILHCADPDQLDVWLKRALTVTSADDLFF